MRGLGIIIGYILGNEKARNWCIEKICQASCIVEKEFKKTQLGQILTKDKNNDDVSKID
jgi:hypothetical protein